MILLKLMKNCLFSKINFNNRIKTNRKLIKGLKNSLFLNIKFNNWI